MESRQRLPSSSLILSHQKIINNYFTVTLKYSPRIPSSPSCPWPLCPWSGLLAPLSHSLFLPLISPVLSSRIIFLNHHFQHVTPQLNNLESLIVSHIKSKLLCLPFKALYNLTPPKLTNFASYYFSGKSFTLVGLFSVSTSSTLDTWPFWPCLC